MASRRRILLTILTAFAVVAAACGDDDTETGGGSGDRTTSTSARPADDTAVPIAVAVADRDAPVGDPALAGAAITAAGYDIFGALRADAADANVIASPASIAMALAMLEPGASGEAIAQMRELLRVDDPDAWHASMNALEQDLEGRQPESFNAEDVPGEVIVRIANAAYLQEGYPFEPAYLDVVGRHYGPVLNEVDFGSDPDAVAHAINDFVAAATNDLITDLIDDGVIKPETVLALVNALYFKASWLQPFPAELTADGPFTTLDGGEVTVPMMSGRSSASTQGDGWVGATKAYVGGLAVQFLLPDEGRFDEVAADLDVIFDSFEGHHSSSASLVMPRFETRFHAELSSALRSLGLEAVYSPGSLLGVANDPRLAVDQVIHQAFVAMDEEGTEAAAATVILGYTTSAGGPPVDVVLDRPFFFRILDQHSGTMLFVGQVTDPSG